MFVANSMDGRPAVILGSCALFVIPLAFYLMHKRKNKAITGPVTTSTKAKTADPVLDFSRENLTLDSAKYLSFLINSSDHSARPGFLLFVQQASAFSSNFSAIRESGCLKTLLEYLSQDRHINANRRETLCILQTVANLACDQDNFPVIKDHMEMIFNIANAQEYSDESCAALQLLCNLALTPTGCLLLRNRICFFYRILETRDPYMLRQVLAVLVNLSCDIDSSQALLNSEVPSRLLHSLNFPLSPAVHPLLTLQTVTFLKNLYTKVHSSPSIFADQLARSNPRSMFSFLCNVRTSLRIRLALTRSELTSPDSTEELFNSIDELVQLLDDASFDSSQPVNYAEHSAIAAPTSS
ncbi:hypothetical protein CRM22_008365 [Opisthorchis felineus]|uniref:Armadillo repeat-containing domain-containing protein n=1 Tax=Opisthorchis felineus TaxID=147828 RepID=A0A4S2LJI0_OPIFE|nr:hypothetical protein CRM22_008365 [Opisthorchis felineus]